MGFRTTRDPRSERGQSLVEFALVAPLLLLILFGIVQFGIAFKNSITIADAARAGARTAAVNRTAADPVAVAKQAVLNASTDLDTSKVTVSVTSPWQQGSDVTVKASYPYSIDILGIVVASGNLSSSTTERVE